ncbi:MAG: SAM-dependent methyltransferase [Nocardioidaceae bacterium]
MRAWLAWHDAYDDPASSLSRRLNVVRWRLGEVLDASAGEPCQLLSLCAGDGHDVIPVLAARTASSPVSALLVEQDEDLARRAAAAVTSSGLESVGVRCADAGNPSSFDDVVPVDVLLLCGIFGNIEHSRVKGTIDVLHHVLAPGGYLIWTRGGSDPDRRPEVRSWFRAAGFDEVSFDGAPEPFGVGVNQPGSIKHGDRRQLPRQLFRFVEP